ncbi:HGxxPAAW family protein [Flexivirga alba]|uniref:HGxxPAAW family protein n=1 Tax=Flexivirga alba TaxID=702742 RepID=A0ABW2ALV5_9MICO
MAEEIHEDHGHSVAAWTTVCFLLVASICVSIGVAWGLHPFYYIGGALAVVGVLVGKAMGKMGFGNHHKLHAPPLTAEERAQIESQRAS